MKKKKKKESKESLPLFSRNTVEVIHVKRVLEKARFSKKSRYMPFLSEVTFCFFVSVIYVNLLRKFSSLLFYLMALKKVIILGLVSGETSGFRRALFVFLPQNSFSFLKKISNFCEISQFQFSVGIVSNCI